MLLTSIIGYLSDNKSYGSYVAVNVDIKCTFSWSFKHFVLVGH